MPATKRKVLVLLPTLFNPRDRGGIQVFNRYFVEALRQLGHEVRVIALNDRSEDANEPWWTPCSDRPRWRRVKMVREAWRSIRRFKPDLVINGHVNLSSMCLWLKRTTGRAYITITHGIDVWSLSPARRRGLLGSDRIVAVSRFTKRKLVEQLGEYPPERVVVFPNTFDPDRFVPKSRRDDLLKNLGIAADQRVIFTVCRLAETERPKGYDKVVQAMPRVLQEVPNAVYLLGGRGKDAERIESLIRELKLDGRVVLPGFIPDDELVDYYNLCDVFVMPSVKEGFGIVYLEAMACGKPCVAGNRDGSVDALLDGEVGLLVDPDDNEALANAITRILNRDVDPLLLDGPALRQRIIDEYGFERFGERLAALIEVSTGEAPQDQPETTATKESTS